MTALSGAGRNRRARRWPRPRTVGHAAVVLTAVAVILGSLGFLVAAVVYDQRVEKALLGQVPAQFRGQIDAAHVEDYGQVFGVAHNAGDSIGTAIRALVANADVIEIDVIAVNGRLYAGHTVPSRVLGQSEFRGPPLRDVWVVASAAEAIQLDLKASTAGYLNLLFDFLATQRGGPPVVITTGSVVTLRAFADRSPETLRFYSIDSRSRIDTVQNDPDLLALIDGISIREDLVDEETATWFTDRNRYVWVWTVNRIERVNDLVKLGVDAITTDNLAILELLGSGKRGERPLARPSPPATPVPAEEETGDEGGGGGNNNRPP